MRMTRGEEPYDRANRHSKAPNARLPSHYSRVLRDPIKVRHWRPPTDHVQENRTRLNACPAPKLRERSRSCPRSLRQSTVLTTRSEVRVGVRTFSWTGSCRHPQALSVLNWTQPAKGYFDATPGTAVSALLFQSTPQRSRTPAPPALEFRQFLLRGLPKVRVEWDLVSGTLLSAALARAPALRKAPPLS